MSIISPQQRDFQQVLYDVGLTIVIRTITRTVDDDGLVTAVTESDTSITAIVDEIEDKRFDLLNGGFYDVGDLSLHVDPDVEVKLLDKVVWNDEIYGVKRMNYPVKIAGSYPYLELHCIKDTDV